MDLLFEVLNATDFPGDMLRTSVSARSGLKVIMQTLVFIPSQSKKDRSLLLFFFNQVHLFSYTNVENIIESQYCII